MKLSRRDVVIVGAALMVYPAVGRAAQTIRVRIPAESAAFDPAMVQAKLGDTVEWTNDSIVTHTVTCDPSKVQDKKNCSMPDGAKPFNSGDMEYEGTFTHVFTVPGTYRYFCIPHENMGMVATIVVA